MTGRRTVLITGCSSPQGIGFATARTLARAGHSVHVTVRSHAHLDELLHGLEDRLFVHDLDLLDRASMRSTVLSVLGSDGRLDTLINNAGYGLIGGVEQVDVDQARLNFETNFFGTIALIQEVLPAMRRQRSGHIVNISTTFAAGLCPPAIGFYIATKSALEAVSQALAIEVEPWGIYVTNFQPGPVMTELSRQWGERLTGDEDPRPTLTDELYEWVLADQGPGTQSAQEVATALREVVELDSPPLAAQSGPGARSYAAAALRDPTRATERAAMVTAFDRS
ncbi:MAG TPA: SDR family oxidoreductase [Solirubrobacteraceae bacterium]|nr:SDR family oxidoreductase [Solirubrobacteraceae bacterium]